ncbi:DUF3077 domain-containing protein [Pseudomonas sp. zfem002]|uniref:DUF3077 domain-containing protein n=1 Tax=Pseudomonas sp. zfem002 TaxID=3078197 RepID=UPI002929A047|nr:DUF3077 domain-containing protein [Pseudomonas sp. zfem002]MDU9389535.1 DUF3077 domain-containing protein [Pseudomonas sp. zfem002]
MKKIVPDPPLSPTCSRAFGECPSHPPLFSVNAGIDPHSALVHTSMFLRCAYESAQQSLSPDSGSSSFPWLTMHAVEAAKAVVDGLLEGIEQESWKEPIS